MIQLFNERRELAHLGKRWVPDGEFNKSLESLSKFADFYLVRHKIHSVMSDRIFNSYKDMIAELIVTAMGGDEIFIYPLFHENCVVAGSVPDMDGLIPYSR